MPSRIEVYVRINKNVAYQKVPVRLVVDSFQPRLSRSGLPSSDGRPSGTENVMPESDESALKCAREVAASKGLRIEVCDINTFGGKVKARMRGVRVTPTIIIGNSRIEGESTLGQLKSKLESCIARA